LLLTRGSQLVLLSALVLLLLLLLLLLLVLLLLPWVVVLAHKLLLMPQRLAPLPSVAARLQHQMKLGRSFPSGDPRGQLLQELLWPPWCLLLAKRHLALAMPASRARGLQC
jgi:hypothetical protein